MVFILLFLFIFGCQKTKIDKNGINLRLTLNRFSVTESFSGKKNWILFADSASEIHNNSYTIYGVNLFFLSFENETASKLTSDSGYVYEETGDLIAYSNVIITTLDSIKLFSDSLKWDNKNEKMIIEGAFKYFTNKEYIEGEGMETDRFLKEIYIKNKIKGKGEYIR